METVVERRGKRFVTWVVGLCIVACGAAAARAEKPGAMIVAQAADGRTVEGELLSVGNGEIEVLAKGEAAKVRLRLDELTALRVERRSRILPGIGILAGATALIGTVGNDGNFGFSQGESVALSAILIGVAGGVIGGIVGALQRKSESIHLRPAPQGGFIRLEARLAKRARFGYR